MRDYFVLRIKRQFAADTPSYIEEFPIPYKPNMNVVSSLMELRKNPVNSQGAIVNPVAWECNCMEEVCGACTMLVNDVPRQACSALIDPILEEYGFETPIDLAPLTKFPVVRDLLVDRQVMFENLKTVQAWVTVDGSFPLGRGPRFNEKTRRWAYDISRCMTCGCCLEACPNYNRKSDFIGANVISQVRMFNAHPVGSLEREDRLAALMEHGGIQECGNSQNCARVCPKEIPLTTSIADINMQANLFSFKRFFKK